KLFVGMMEGLQNPAVIEQKIAEEKALREAVEKDPTLKKAYGDAWQQVEESVTAQKQLSRPYALIEGGGRGLGTGQAFNSQLFGIARALVRYADEKEKPNAERLREFRESALPSLKTVLFSPAPIYDDFEALKLGDSLGMFVELQGADDALVKVVL